MRYEFESTKKCSIGVDWNINSPKAILKYAVGALLYTPATHPSIAEDICSMRYKDLKSIVLCLEDSITDEAVEYAEEQLYATLEKIYMAAYKGGIQIDCIPLIFIRIRNPFQMRRVFDKIKNFSEMFTGFILPKFDAANMNSYLEELQNINSKVNNKTVYIMPIIESSSIASIETRTESLVNIRKALSDIYDFVLNIRVGGNDFCNQFGFRRSMFNTIYDIGVLNTILCDIINVLGREYVVSAPVWEYFGNNDNDDWLRGLKAEIALDKLNGFSGKTAIHPSQLLAIQEAMAVEYVDYKDSMEIMNWENEILGVQKSAFKNRMNEVKVHKSWAERILARAEVYGVKANEK